MATAYVLPTPQGFRPHLLQFLTGIAVVLDGLAHLR